MFTDSGQTKHNHFYEKEKKEHNAKKITLHIHSSSESNGEFHTW